MKGISPTRLFVLMSGFALVALIVSPFLGMLFYDPSIHQKEGMNRNAPVPNQMVRGEPTLSNRMVTEGESDDGMPSQAQPLSGNSEIYWDLSCPWEMKHLGYGFRVGTFFEDPEYLSRPYAQSRENFIEMAHVSKDFSLSHQTVENFRNNANALKRRRTVVIGDSLSRQLFISFACLVPEDMIESHVTPWSLNMEHEIEFFDSRIKLKPYGELFYAPKAGGVNHYDWNREWSGEWSPIESSDDKNWLRSCQERRPFQFDANYIPPRGPNAAHEGIEKIEYKEGDQEIETITLSKEDVVVISAGVHTPRPENLQSLEALMDCMEEARKEGSDMNWPEIVYLKTSLKHFFQENGYNLCAETNYHREDEMAEIAKFGDRMHMLAKDMDMTEMGYLHVKAMIPDCVHWFQPGLPDLWAVELAEYESRLDRMNGSTENA